MRTRVYRYMNGTYILCTNNNNINERPIHRYGPSSVPQRWKNTIHVCRKLLPKIHIR